MRSQGESVGWRIWQIRRAHRGVVWSDEMIYRVLVSTGCPPYDELFAK